MKRAAQPLAVDASPQAADSARWSRNRRWLLLGGVTVALGALLVASMALVQTGSRSVRLVTTTGKRSSGSAKPVPSTTPAPSASPTPVPSPSPSLTPVPTSSPVRAVSSGLKGASRTPQPTPTPDADEVIECGSADLALTTATDKANYPPESPVTISTAAQNISSHSCHVEFNPCGLDSVTVVDESGRLVWDSMAGPIASPIVCAMYLGLRPLAPKESFTLSYTWKQQECTTESCPESSVPPGQYRALGHWQHYGDAAATSFWISRF